MKRILIAGAALALTAGMGFAGSYTAPVVEAAPEAPAPVVTQNADWTGAYVGAQIGYGKVNKDFDANGAVGGLHAGYLKDFGKYVVGGELAYSGADLTDKAANAKVNSFTDMKLIGGVPNGKWLYYGALGGSYVDAKAAGTSYSDLVPMVGAGVKYQLNDKWALGGEVDYRDGHNFDSTGNNVNLTTVAMTASFRF